MSKHIVTINHDSLQKTAKLRRMRGMPDFLPVRMQNQLHHW